MPSELMAPLLKQIPDWQLVTIEGIQQLEKTFNYKNFNQGMLFANQVAELAEEEDHHPAITIEWGRVLVRWWSHSTQGVNLCDFICAAKTDRLFFATQHH